MQNYKITAGEVEAFHHEGYILVPGLFDVEEMDLLSQVARADRELAAATRERRDATGGITTLSLSNEVHDDVYGAIVRCRRLVDTMETLLGGEVYHYHHKMNFKEPRVGGAWEWHQDYGYWYDNGCLFPWMASALIAVDPATRENGCLQVIAQSHHMGRIDHGKTGDQTGADMERVDAALARLPHVYVEMQRGDTLFFHSNLLHRSDRNTSERPRWALICCYNAARNDPYKESKHPRYAPLEKWPDERVCQVARRQLAARDSAAAG